MCYQLPVTKATRDGTCAIRQAFLPSGPATVVFFLASLLWQQEIHEQQNHVFPCHQFLHEDSGAIQFSLGLSVNLYLIKKLDMFSLLVDCTSSRCTQHTSRSEEKNVQTHRFTDKHTPVLGSPLMNVSAMWKGKIFSGMFIYLDIFPYRKDRPSGV